MTPTDSPVSSVADDDRVLVTVAVTRYAEPNWLVRQALVSLSKQRGVRLDVLFLDQAPDEASSRLCEELSNDAVKFKYAPIPAKSLSFARNEAIRRALGNIILFLDCDAIASPDWAQILGNLLVEESVGVVGARILPLWRGKPLFIARSKLVLDQYSIYDLGSERISVRRVFGTGFGIHRERLKADAYFDETLGRRNGVLISGEETDLCRRAKNRGLDVVYAGAAVARHQILPERISYRWVQRRFFYSGVSRARCGGTPNPTNAFGIWDLLVLPLVLPSYLAGYLDAKRRARR